MFCGRSFDGSDQSYEWCLNLATLTRGIKIYIAKSHMHADNPYQTPYLQSYCIDKESTLDIVNMMGVVK